MSGILNTSIARKIAMALSGLFLIIFLTQHFIINFTSVVSPESFNEISHFMGTNPLVQFLLQPVLIFGVVFHFVMGFILELQNRAARTTGYAVYKGSANANWVSRNMIISGLVVLAFMGLHFYDFWVPEMIYKYVEFNSEDPNRYYEELVHKFESPARTGIYAVSFILLALHLWHGFQSAFQTMGVNNKYTPAIKNLGKAFAVLIPFGFVVIAIFHHFNH
ncbi:succinate dehydrogenase cytochrome b subunit [Robertkochia marina]|uniref:Succinate dehydrogenase cytochrome b subunit n=1 Tax=Robertkochia marina TaxID=1227945 RepID=A0A4V3UYE8_9FLAO|nr:succinate dehydrogenase cytochrome b subunit [Robertkochia marina]THD69388.1 succinate dehydrogenase cytochrome b subunit [Robertkochia marina]TRZ47351.1 succinate dehydrogenase [Robertkochia marina]